MAFITPTDWTRIKATVAHSEAQRGTRAPHPGDPVFRRGYPWGTRFDFGISVVGLVVTVHPGTVYRGGLPVTLAAAKSVTLTDAFVWVAIAFYPNAVPGDDMIDAVRWEAAGEPQDADGVAYRGLAKFTVNATAGTATLARYRPVTFDLFGH
jgi:hypothetical protein